MRLTCPNCGAQYEVADDVIPLSGRDVQCSACGNTWFQRPGEEPGMADTDPSPDPAWDEDATPEAELDETPPEPEAVSDTWPDPAEADGGAAPDRGADMDAPIEGDEAADDDGAADTADDRADAPPPSPRRALDPDLADMLREEAELARSARQAERIETQTDLGLDGHLSAEEQRAREAQARMARLRGEADPVDTPEPEPDSAARHRLLPDIDEINDTLRGETAAAGAAAAATVAGAEAARRGGLRRGFITVVVIAVLAAVLYLLAPMLAERFPTLAPPLAAYTDWVDGIRLWLDLKLQGLMSGDAATAD